MLLTDLLPQDLPPASSVDAGQAGTEAPGSPGAPAPAPAANPLSWLQPVLLFGLLFLFMWFMVIRPERRRQRERSAMLGALKKGDTVVTTGGMFGVIARIDEHSITLKVEDDIRLKFERNAVARVVSSREQESAADEPKELAAGRR